MKCKKIRNMMITQFRDKLDPQEKLAMEKHLTVCSECQLFVIDFEQIRQSVKKQSFPALSETFQSQTLERCHRILVAQSQKTVSRAPVPRWIWIALSIGVVISIFLFFTVIRDLLDNTQLSAENMQVLLFILQNIMMLILTPAVLKQYQTKQFNKGLSFQRVE